MTWKIGREGKREREWRREIGVHSFHPKVRECSQARKECFCIFYFLVLLFGSSARNCSTHVTPSSLSLAQTPGEIAKESYVGNFLTRRLLREKVFTAVSTISLSNKFLNFFLIPCYLSALPPFSFFPPSTNGCFLILFCPVYLSSCGCFRHTYTQTAMQTRPKQK
jgi:hypothetical protein